MCQGQTKNIRTVQTIERCWKLRHPEVHYWHSHKK